MPKLYVIAGCNGAGKTTASRVILPEMLGCREFVNADEIAKGISPFNPEGVAIEAGRLMLQRMDRLLAADRDFAFETTLATRSHVGFIERARAKGYFVTLIYFWLPTPEQAVERVAARVREGGHHIPEEVIRRRYVNGIRNLASYRSVSDCWVLYDNRAADGVHKIAWGIGPEIKEVLDTLSYRKMTDMDRIEIERMLERIDAGILLAQKRLVEKARKTDGELVVLRDGKVVRIKARDLR